MQNIVEAQERREVGEDAIEEAVGILNDVVRRYDKTWLVGHKGDHHRTLEELGVEGLEIDVMHVHSTLGAEANVSLTPPEGSGGSYEDLLDAVNPAIEEQIIATQEADEKVAVLMPFPNGQFSELVRKHGAEKHFRMATSVENPRAYSEIEDKIHFAEMMDVVQAENEHVNTIPWVQLDGEATFEGLTDYFDLDDGQAVYAQLRLSGGGDGTKRINSQEALQGLLQDEKWRQSIESGDVKVTAEVKDAYPANGTACIVPTEDGECMVLLGAPSHKPVGLSELNGKEGAGVGNDWTQPWSDEVRVQYEETATAIGKHLYEKYGYTGLFGPDCLVQMTEDGEPRLFVNEVNPRTQGTTPYDSMNALKAGVPPIDVIHHTVQLGEEADIAALCKVIGTAEQYNGKSLEVEGCFYMKIGAPREEMTVETDVNGAWLVIENPDPEQPGTMIRLDDEKTSMRHVATDELDETVLNVRRHLEGAEVPHSVVIVKGPRVGDKVGGQLAPIGYIVGAEKSVFTADEPGVTPEGQYLYNTVIGAMR